MDGIGDQFFTRSIFTSDEYGAPTKPGSLMVVPMTEQYANEAFGTVPPNLSLISRVRGTSWLYSYLKGFYLDPTREPIGVNNTVFPDVGMPHEVVVERRRPALRRTDDEEGGKCAEVGGHHPPGAASTGA